MATERIIARRKKVVAVQSYMEGGLWRRVNSGVTG
jgi:hypothetical protein